MNIKILYAHGFASSPSSRKAKTFQSALAEKGIDLIVPALDGGDFAHLTITGQLKIMEDAIQNEPVMLIGSSMGGYLAALYASQHPETKRLVLMAPAFEFAPRWHEKIVPGEDMKVYHYGEKRFKTVHYGLIEDALRHDSSPNFTQPALIFHGRNDETVPIEYSRNFVASHPYAKLVEMESDHELVNVLDEITSSALEFLCGNPLCR